MAVTILLETNLEVIDKQRQLITEALGPDGAYIRTKETLEELFKDGEVKGTERANLIASTLSQMVNNITTSSMSTALQWELQEKELYLKKQELELQFEAMGLANGKAKQDVQASEASKHLLQAKLLREYGNKTINSNGDLVALDDSGKVYEETRLVKQEVTNKELLPAQIHAQTHEVNARTHKLVADTYINHGLFTGYNITENGIATASKVNIGYVTLSDMNKQVAKEQAKGYAWNAWSNSASASAGMIGTLIASEVTEVVEDARAGIDNWKVAVNKLSSLKAPEINI